MPATIGRIFGALLCLFAGEALAAEKAQGITRDGVEILLGLIPALMIQGDRPPHAGQRRANGMCSLRCLIHRPVDASSRQLS